MKIEIQPISNSTQIIEVIHAAFKRYETDPMPSSALAETSKTIEQDLANGIQMFGAFHQNLIIGIVKVTIQNDAIYFSRLAVVPEHQGKGVATALVAHIEKLATTLQISRVTCKVRKSEEDNIRLYTKLRYYSIMEEMSTSPLGFVMATVTMEKKLNNPLCSGIQ